MGYKNEPSLSTKGTQLSSFQMGINKVVTPLTNTIQLTAIRLTHTKHHRLQLTKYFTSSYRCSGTGGTQKVPIHLTSNFEGTLRHTTQRKVSSSSSTQAYRFLDRSLATGTSTSANLYTLLLQQQRFVPGLRRMNRADQGLLFIQHTSVQKRTIDF